MVTGSPAGLEVCGLGVRYGRLRAVSEVDLQVAPGEIVAVVGPSGCGKTTLLRAIAGLEPSAAGTVSWAGTDLRSVAPHARGFGLVFQDHALFPHRTVGENVAFGLRMKGLGRAARRERTEAMLHLVGLAGYGDRRVDTLSGGEAQRVALARALAPAPRLLMLDEPLGALDRALRERLADELATLLRSLGQAAIHVTHDQDEAFAVADRLVVMRDGRIRRDGPAAEVWRDPGERWVAEFLGHRNVLDAGAARALGLTAGDRAVLVPEQAIRLGTLPGPGQPSLTGRVAEVRARAGSYRVHLRVDDPPVDLVVAGAEPPALGERCPVTIDVAAVVALEPEECCAPSGSPPQHRTQAPGPGGLGDDGPEPATGRPAARGRRRAR